MLRICGPFILYALALLGANFAAASEQDFAAIQALREGSMKKLLFHEIPRPVSSEAFYDSNGAAVTLSEFRPKIVVLNFWATWCAPCLKELPTLDALNENLGGDKFEVLAVATGRSSPEDAAEFLLENNIDSLDLYLDPKLKFLRGTGVLGLPTTIVVNGDGNEIARLIGDADWNSESAIEIFEALISDR